MNLKPLLTLPGSGILRGMTVTAANWIGTWFDPERLVTVQYPEERTTPPENMRSFPFLVYDGDDPDTGLRCVACKICERECPPGCIAIDQARDDQGKPVKHPARFDIDISVCMSCQICVEVCPFDSIKMDKEFELSTFDRFRPLVLAKERLRKSNDYYHRIRPREAAEVDARLKAERERKEAAKQRKQEAGNATG